MPRPVRSIKCGPKNAVDACKMIADFPDITALGERAERITFPCGDGELIARKWGAGRPVILLHGGSGSWMHWIDTIEDLSRDHEVWAFDLPGLGDSAMPPAPHIPQSCADVLAPAIRTAIPADRRPLLVGFSFGGHVGTLTAAQLNGHLAGFVISACSALGIVRPRLEAFPKERLGMSKDERRDIHRRVLEILMISKPERIDDRAIAIQAENVAKARFRSREFAKGDDIKRRLADVTVPLRAIWGRNDVLAYPDVANCYRIIGAHHPELVTETVEDAGHWVMYEQPAAFSAALRRLIAATP